jgi:hypothetical protein
MIHCNAEWHLRDNPRAHLIYTMGLSIAKGTGSFYASQPQLAEFFGWDLKTVRAAFKALRAAGLFTLLRSGRGGNGQGGFANSYAVTTHSKLAKNKYPCRPLPETGALPLPETGVLNDQTPSQKLVGDPSQKPAGDPYQKPVPYSPKYSPNNSSSDAITPGKKSAASPAKPAYFPANFIPNDENRALAKELGLDIESALISFSEHHKAKGDKMVDWYYSFNAWMRTARNLSLRVRPAASVTTGSLTENFRDLIARSK